MDVRRFALSLALVACVPGSACAMNAPKASGLACDVQRGELLPAASGGAEALCADIKQALDGVRAEPARVAIRVISAHAIAATVTVGGKDLPEIRLDRMDRELSRDALQRFAQAIATGATASRRP